MKQYQARTKDLKTVLEAFLVGTTEEHAKSVVSLYPGSWVLVLAEWESEAEADKARLDWLEKNGRVPTGWVHSGSVRKAIDAARNAPKPKVTVVG